LCFVIYYSTRLAIADYSNNKLLVLHNPCVYNLLVTADLIFYVVDIVLLRENKNMFFFIDNVADDLISSKSACAKTAVVN